MKVHLWRGFINSPACGMVSDRFIKTIIGGSRPSTKEGIPMSAFPHEVTCKNCLASQEARRLRRGSPVGRGSSQ